MVLSNVEILKALRAKHIIIDPIAGDNPAVAPFNTSAVDLRLGNQLMIPPNSGPAAYDLRNPGLADFLTSICKREELSENRPYTLKPGKLVLGKTLEYVSFPLGKKVCYSARVEGKSSLARCGILVHFTAPTIHAGFSGTITLELINLGSYGFLLYPEMFVCQLVIEEVKGSPASAPSQFHGQRTPAGK